MNAKVRFVGFNTTPLACEQLPVFVADEPCGYLPVNHPLTAAQIRAAGYDIPPAQAALAVNVRHTINNTHCDENLPQSFAA